MTIAELKALVADLPDNMPVEVFAEHTGLSKGSFRVVQPGKDGGFFFDYSTFVIFAES